ncbi:MAG: class I SAM-dependent methyltransferase [Pirellulales bacterium]
MTKNAMLERVLEPEVMDDRQESIMYDQMDHQVVNQRFVDDMIAFGPVQGRILDLGTGTARIPILICEAVEHCRVMACDLAVTMLDIAKLNIAIAGFETRIQLYHGDAKSLDCQDDECDWVISNSLIHHLPYPASAFQHALRVLRPGGRVFIRDLFRPESQEAIESIVSTYAAEEPPENQQLLRQSLAAALSLREVRELVQSCGFPVESVQQSSDRHWTWAAVKPS